MLWLAGTLPDEAVWLVWLSHKLTLEPRSDWRNKWNLLVKCYKFNICSSEKTAHHLSSRNVSQILSNQMLDQSACMMSFWQLNFCNLTYWEKLRWMNSSWGSRLWSETETGVGQSVREEKTSSLAHVTLISTLSRDSHLHLHFSQTESVSWCWRCTNTQITLQTDSLRWSDTRVQMIYTRNRQNSHLRDSKRQSSAL